MRKRIMMALVAVSAVFALSSCDKETVLETIIEGNYIQLDPVHSNALFFNYDFRLGQKVYNSQNLFPSIRVKIRVNR